MGQIKITISDKEKADIEAKAKAAGMTVSKYLRERIICSPYVSDPTLPETINYQNRARLWAVIPEELLKSINEEAKSAGMSRSEYITRLFVQKGKPVFITYSFEPTSCFGAGFSKGLRNIQQLKDMADRSGTIYSNDLNAAIRDLNSIYRETRVALNRINRTMKHSTETVRSEILRRKEGKL